MYESECKIITFEPMIDSYANIDVIFVLVKIWLYNKLYKEHADCLQPVSFVRKAFEITPYFSLLAHLKQNWNWNWKIFGIHFFVLRSGHVSDPYFGLTNQKSIRSLPF